MTKRFDGGLAMAKLPVRTVDFNAETVDGEVREGRAKHKEDQQNDESWHSVGESRGDRTLVEAKDGSEKRKQSKKNDCDHLVA